MLRIAGCIAGLGLLITLLTVRAYSAEDAIHIAISGAGKVNTLQDAILEVSISNVTTEAITIETISREPPITLYAAGDDGTQYIVRGPEYLTKNGKSSDPGRWSKNREYFLNSGEIKQYSKTLSSFLAKGERLSEPPPGTVVRIYALLTQVKLVGGQYQPSSIKSNVFEMAVGTK